MACQSGAGTPPPPLLAHAPRHLVWLLLHQRLTFVPPILPLCCATHSGVVLRVLFHPKQLMVVSSGDDAEVRVWDLVTKSCAAGGAGAEGR